MENILAKDDQDLLSHSKCVEKYSDILLKELILEEEYEKLKHAVKYASLLHDIGKCTTHFQSLIKSKKSDEKYKFRHNEVGWAFVSKYLLKDFKDKDFILNTIYWHHGISNQQGHYTNYEILNDIDDESINCMLEYLKLIVGEENVISEFDEDFSSEKSPLYHPNDFSKQPKLGIIRSCVCSGDRKASAYRNIEDINEEVVKSDFKLKSEITFDEKYFEGDSRFQKKKEIVDRIKGTTILKAPTAFGKTLTSILYILNKGGKSMYVTPRNTLAIATYFSVLEELKKLNSNASVQLILGGEIKDSSDDSDLYEADIIITNIDNFLAPAYKNNILEFSTLLLGTTVVFDEYHELITKSALMSAFDIIMKQRYRFTKQNTILMSATPIPIQFMWQTITSKNTVVLPNDIEHYESSHDKKFKLFVKENAPEIKPNSSSLVIQNSIKNSQEEMRNGDYKELIHSNFLDDVKKKKLIDLLEEYSEEKENNSNKPNITSTHILEAGLNMSFERVVLEVCSPHGTVQANGRNNRFGNYENPELWVVRSSDFERNALKSNNMAVNLRYDTKLRDHWFDYLKQYDEQEFTLNEFYEIYNRYMKDHSKEIERWIKSVREESKRALQNVYPIKYNKNIEGEKIRVAGSNKLRTQSKEVFYMVRHERTNEWVGPFVRAVGDFGDTFNEKGSIFHDMKKAIKKIIQERPGEFAYEKILKKRTNIDTLRKYAKFENTPYLDFSRKYSDSLGVI